MEEIEEMSAAQDYAMWIGDWCAEPGRMGMRALEPLLRHGPRPFGEKVSLVVQTIFFFTLAIPCSLLSLGCYTFAMLAPGGRFLRVAPAHTPTTEKVHKTSLRILFWNVALQDPWSPLTAGVVPPLSKIDGKTRVQHLADKIGEENPDIVFLQECENGRATRDLIGELRRQGYTCIWDAAPGCINSSGLLLAAKVPLISTHFFPYPAKDREGLAKGSRQGFLWTHVEVNGKTIQLGATHLNYGGDAFQAVRERQMEHIKSRIGPNSIVVGDFNCSKDKLGPLTNYLSGKVTCQDTGKHTLRGKPIPEEGCEDCAEQIDGLFATPNVGEEPRIDFFPKLSDHARVTWDYQGEPA